MLLGIYVYVLPVFKDNRGKEYEDGADRRRKW